MSEFPNCEIKLCDLEVSRVIQDSEQIRQIIGTPDYVGKILYYGPGVYILRRNSFFRGLTELPYLEYVLHCSRIWTIWDPDGYYYCLFKWCLSLVWTLTTDRVACLWLDPEY